LSAHLRRRSELEVASLRPRHLGPLVQIFPILADVWSLKGSPVRRFEPGEMRRLGLAALRELLTRLGDERPLVIHIDDFQWADVDGARLLTSLVRPPDPPALLLLVSFRDDDLEDNVEDREGLHELLSTEARLGRDLRELELEPLSSEEAEQLAFQLMVEAEGARTDAQREFVKRRAESYARGARGNPFYIGQMVLDAASSSDESHAGDDRIVARRIVALSDEARRILATVAVAGGPTPIPVVRRVYEALSGDQSWVDGLTVVDELIDQLCELGLLAIRDELDSQESAPRSYPTSVIDVTHGRIREVTVGELEPGELRQIHRELGFSLEFADGPPEALAEHFEHAGERARAAKYTEIAAKQAVEALAFGRAVALYRRTLELLAEDADGGDIDPGRRLGLRLALADQLVNFGRS
ncbi:MAG: hypothetical protein KC457_32890, partial [Myxococcales bacterium]|nr:hypothetical protein [Myxococcales bacterium]